MRRFCLAPANPAIECSQSTGELARAIVSAIEARGFSVVIVALIGLLAGTLIGSVGIGGVIVVPALTYILKYDIKTAIANALMGFALTGVVGTIQYARAGAINWQRAAILALAAMPAALMATIVTHLANKLVLKIVVATVVLSAGIQAIFSNPRGDTRYNDTLSANRLAAVGFVAGFASVLTGTGGPLLLMPALMWLQQPVVSSIGLSQIIQLPISLVPTFANLEAGRINLIDGTTLAIALAVGCWVGSSVALRLPVKALQKSIAYILVVIGILMIFDIATSDPFWASDGI